MRDYEVLFVINPDLDQEAIDAVVDKFTELINGRGGSVESVDKWGKRRLAYEINDRKEGFYTLINFKAESEVSQEVERIMKITDDVMRYLITRKEA